MKSKHIRIISQIAFFVLVGAIIVNHEIVEGGAKGIPFLPEARLHAICPFGAVETFASLITGVGLVRQLKASVMVIGTVVLFMTILFGPVFCSHICPLGSIQEWFGKLGKKYFAKKYNRLIPKRLHNVLKYVRYIVLVLILVQTYRSASLLFVNFDPYYALYHFWTSEVTLSAIAVLVVTLLLSLFVERPWCKYACPYGGLLGIIGQISPFKIRRNENTCISCGKCDNECPMLIDISSKKTVRDTLCNRCMKCTYEEGGCPVDGASYIGTGIKKVKEAE